MHLCKRLFLLDTYSIEEMDELHSESNEGGKYDAIEPEISLRAFKRKWYVDTTMHTLVCIKGKQVIVLLDTGSSQNFLNSTVATQMIVEASSQNQVKVKVASGQCVQSIEGFVRHYEWIGVHLSH